MQCVLPNQMLTHLSNSLWNDTVVMAVVVAAWEGEHSKAANAEHIVAVRQQGEHMLSSQGLPSSLFQPQLVQQWVDGAALELPPVNAVR